MSFYLFRKLIRKVPGIVIKIVPLPEPKIIEGFESRKNVGSICKSLGYKTVLLVTDKTLLSLEFHKSILEAFNNYGIKVEIFADISSEPSIETVTKGGEIAAKFKAECVIALGGGSVLDASKIIAAYAAHPKRRITSFLHKFVFAKTLPIIAIPSTAGTGAEQTVGAIIKNKNGIKKSTVIVGLNVPYVILDSALTLNAPKSVTIGCGVDALSHGLEGYLADIKTSKEDIRKSQECVKLVLENLPELIKNPTDIERRQKLCLAANYGGNAINKQLAGYVHAFAHTIGAYYHISHGEAIAYSIYPIALYNKKICEDKFAALSIYCGFANENDTKEKAADKFLLQLKNLLILCGYSQGFDKIKEKDYHMLIKGINSDSINYSAPKTLKNKEIIYLLKKINGGI